MISSEQGIWVQYSSPHAATVRHFLVRINGDTFSHLPFKGNLRTENKKRKIMTTSFK